MYKIYLDPGHGGNDRYNVGPTGYVEADGMLKQAHYLRQALERQGQFEITMSRKRDDDSPDLNRRWPNFVADLAISLHSNAWKGVHRGVEVYYSIYRPEDKQWAQALCDKVANRYKVPNRGAKTRVHPDYPQSDYYAVIRNAIAKYAKHSFLVETLFHDNAQDEAILKVDKQLEIIAEDYCEVICRMFNVKYISKEDYEKSKDPWEDIRIWGRNNKISDGNRLDAYCTREMAWVMTMNLLKNNPNFGEPRRRLVFKPIHETSSWAVNSQQWIAHNDIDEGYFPKLFISNEQVWGLLLSIASKMKVAIVTDKSKTPPTLATAWAREAQEWVMYNKIHNGANSTGPVLRGEMIKMLKIFAESCGLVGGNK